MGRLSTLVSLIVVGGRYMAQFLFAQFARLGGVRRDIQVLDCHRLIRDPIIISFTLSVKDVRRSRTSPTRNEMELLVGTGPPR